MQPEGLLHSSLATSSVAATTGASCTHSRSPQNLRRILASALQNDTKHVLESLNIPGEHRAHVFIPARFDVRPDGQSLHAFSEALAAVPGGHDVFVYSQAEAPAVDSFPAAHAQQSESDFVAVVLLENLTAGHSEQK